MQNNRSIVISFVVWFSVVSTSFAVAVQDRPDPAELQLETERVVVFKDGYSLFIKRGLATTDPRGEVFTESVPDAAVLGSVWAIPTTGRLKSMVAGQQEVTEAASQDVGCMATVDVLEANLGREGHVELDNGDVIEGTIRTVLAETRPNPTEPSGISLATGSYSSRSISEVETRSGALFVLATEDGDVLLPIQRVRRLVMRDLKTDCQRRVTTTTHRRRLTLRFDEPAKRQEVTLMYFVPDLRWIPTYRAVLANGSDPTGTLNLQAELLNEREDLDDVPVDLVVGVPHFRFKDSVSPISLEATLRRTLQQAAPHLASQLSNAMFDPSSRGADRLREPGSGSGDVTLPPELSGERAQDLFVYHVDALSLKKGERAIVPILSSRVPVEHLYTWDLHSTHSGARLRTQPTGRESPLRVSTLDVWHQLVLSNTSSAPWTTGPVLLLEDFLPMGQDLLTFTSPGGSVRVPVTVAVGLRGSVESREVRRELNALPESGDDYARVHTEALITMTSAKAAPVNVELTYRLGGRVTETSHRDQVQVTVRAFQRGDWTDSGGAPEVNSHSELVWRTSLAPGASVTLRVNYHYFIRH